MTFVLSEYLKIYSEYSKNMKKPLCLFKWVLSLRYMVSITRQKCRRYSTSRLNNTLFKNKVAATQVFKKLCNLKRVRIICCNYVFKPFWKHVINCDQSRKILVDVFH